MRKRMLLTSGGRCPMTGFPRWAGGACNHSQALSAPSSDGGGKYPWHVRVQIVGAVNGTPSSYTCKWVLKRKFCLGFKKYWRRWKNGRTLGRNNRLKFIHLAFLTLPLQKIMNRF